MKDNWEPTIKWMVILEDRKHAIGRCVAGYVWVTKNCMKRKVKWERIESLKDGCAITLLSEGNNQDF